MSNKRSLKKKFNNCFLDLQRAASSFYLNPEGKNHQVFLQHARKILRGMKNKKAEDFSNKISRLEKETVTPPSDRNKRMNLADKILTLGCLLK